MEGKVIYNCSHIYHYIYIIAGLFEAEVLDLLAYSGVVGERGDCNYLQLGFLWPRPSETDVPGGAASAFSALRVRQWGRQAVIPRACVGEEVKRNGILARLIYNFARETDKTNLLQDTSVPPLSFYLSLAMHTHTVTFISFCLGKIKNRCVAFGDIFIFLNKAQLPTVH